MNGVIAEYEQAWVDYDAKVQAQCDIINAWEKEHGDGSKAKADQDKAKVDAAKHHADAQKQIADA